MDFFDNVLKYLFLIISSFICIKGLSVNVTAAPPMHDVHLTSTPASFLPGLTTKLILNCTFLTTHDSDFTDVMSLIVSKTSPGQTVFNEIASITSHSMDKVDLPKGSLGAKVIGHLSPQEGAYIAFEWAYPSSDVEGQFQCEAFGIDQHGHPKVSKTEIEIVKENEVTPAVLVGEMQTLHALATLSTSRLNSLESFQSDTTDRLNNAMSAIFIASSSFGGHTYRLSRPMLRDISMHDHLCRLFGGYLVEIDSLLEHNFVQDFALTKQGSTMVAVGISDRDHPGNFTFIRSGHQATTFKVGDGYNSNLQHHCVEMWAVVHGGYVDEPCYGPNSRKSVAGQFMCEFTN